MSLKIPKNKLKTDELKVIQDLGLDENNNIAIHKERRSESFETFEQFRNTMRANRNSIVSSFLQGVDQQIREAALLR